VHAGYLNPSELLDERLAAMSQASIGLTAADIPDDDDDTPPGSLPFFHEPAVLVAHMHRERLDTVPASWAGRDLMADGVARWDADYDERKELTNKRSWANRVTAVAKLMLKELRKQEAEIIDYITSPPKPPGVVKPVVEVKRLSLAQRERVKRFADMRLSQRAQVRQRMQYGPVWPGGNIAGRLYGYLNEFLGDGVLRSHLHPHLKRVVQLLPKPDRAMTGMDKKSVTPHTKHDAAVFVRDAPYVHGDPRRLGFLVIDLDGQFLSVAELYRKLASKLPRKLMPPLVVSRKSWCGRYAVENPHLIWPMPAGSEVGVTGKSRMLPQRFFRRVQRALVSVLIEVGADPNQHNASKFKNPLSQVWSVCVMNQDLPSLEDFRGKGGIDLSYDEDEMKERAIKFRATGPAENVSLSNAVWISCKEKIQRAMLLANVFQDKEYRQSKHNRDRRRRWLLNAVMGEMLEEFPDDEEQVRRVVEAHCDWWSSHRGNRAKKAVARGRDRQAIFRAGMDAKEELTTTERRQTSAQQTNQARTAKTTLAIAGVIASMPANLFFTRYAIGQRCEALGIAAESSVYKLYDAALLLLADLPRDGARYIASPNPASAIQRSSLPCHPVDGFPAPDQPPGPTNPGNNERPPSGFWPLPAPCGPPISTEDIAFEFDDARVVPVTAEHCIRPQPATLH
jgi:hypothetical protein